MDEHYIGPIIVICILALIAIGTIVSTLRIWRNQDAAFERPQDRPPAPPQQERRWQRPEEKRARRAQEANGPPLLETGFITEEIRLTAGGALSLLALIFSCLASGYYELIAETIFQKIDAGVAFLGGAVFWGLGLALGRRRTYRTYRYEAEKPE